MSAPESTDEAEFTVPPIHGIRPESVTDEPTELDGQPARMLSGSATMARGGGLVLLGGTDTTECGDAYVPNVKRAGACSNRLGPAICTRAEGHEGAHVAGDGDVIVAAWMSPDESMVAASIEKFWNECQPGDLDIEARAGMSTVRPDENGIPVCCDHRLARDEALIAEAEQHGFPVEQVRKVMQCTRARDHSGQHVATDGSIVWSVSPEGAEQAPTPEEVGEPPFVTYDELVAAKAREDMIREMNEPASLDDMVKAFADMLGIEPDQLAEGGEPGSSDEASTGGDSAERATGDDPTGT